MQKMRLNKFISHNTAYSRREADELIRARLALTAASLAIL